MYSLFFYINRFEMTKDSCPAGLFPTKLIQFNLKKGAQTPDETVSVEDSKGVFIQRERNPILCRRCKNEITTAEHMIAVNGRHQHSFTNPAFITFQIGCFSSASGCHIHGIPTYEFTWFPGYAWAIAVCSKCLLHLGWYYQSEEATFFGLIMDNLLRKIKLH